MANLNGVSLFWQPATFCSELIVCRSVLSWLWLNKVLSLSLPPPSISLWSIPYLHKSPSTLRVTPRPKSNFHNFCLHIRGVRLAKKMTSVRLWKKNCSFRFRFGFTILTAVSIFGSVFWTVCCLMCMTLEMMYFCAELVQLIVNRNDFRIRSAETRHEEKYVDCWSYHAAKWIVNGTM